MAYIYQADIWCDRCGKAILADLDRPTWDTIAILKNARQAFDEDGPAFPWTVDSNPYEFLSNAIDHLTFPSDQDTPDSDDIPVWCDDDCESDSPQHCASHQDCLDALELSDGRKVGYLFGSLTREGYDYTREAIAEKPADPLMIEWASHFDIRIRWTVTLASYCGMSDEIAEDTDQDSARAIVAEYLRDRRLAGYDVATRKRGAEWEILEPDDSALVPDDCGILSLDCEVK